MTSKRILVACIGNIFFGDDAFGVEVAKRLASCKLPDQVQVIDFGIRGIDLAYTLLDGYDVTIFVDATSRGEKAGTLFIIEPDLTDFQNLVPQAMVIDTHDINLAKVLSLVKSMGGELKRVLLVGCEPSTVDLAEQGQLGLSLPVQLAVDEAVTMIESLIAKLELENY